MLRTVAHCVLLVLLVVALGYVLLAAAGMYLPFDGDVP